MTTPKQLAMSMQPILDSASDEASSFEPRSTVVQREAKFNPNEDQVPLAFFQNRAYFLGGDLTSIARQESLQR